MDFPYATFEKTQLWEIIEKAILNLEENQDIAIKTHNKYVVGFLCKELVEKKLAMLGFDSATQLKDCMEIHHK